MKIRTATQDDIPAITELLHALFSIEVDFSLDATKQTQGVELLLKSPAAKIFVAECNGSVVGMCTVQILISTAMGSPTGVVEDVVIAPHHRGKGVGTALLQALEQWAIAHHLTRLQLQADKDNTPALEFYRKRNWNSTNLEGWMKSLNVAESRSDPAES